MTKLATVKLEHLKGDTESLKDLIVDHLRYTLAKDKYTATKRDLFQAVAYTVRDHMVGQWIKTQQHYYDTDVKRVYYLSMEFLIGRTLENSLINLGILENCRQAIADLGFHLDLIIEMERDAGLGNGGLGRLAACFLDSMATLGIPGYGYGIRYDYGIFNQQISEGDQQEIPDNWLRYGNPWEICRSEYLYPIQFYGRVINDKDGKGKHRFQWIDTQEVMAMAYDIPICGYLNKTVNTLRLWQAKSSRGFNLSYFNHGDYIRAIEDMAMTENISKVLYPNDNLFEGKELRLKQEYFLVSATIQDIIRRHNKGHLYLDNLDEKVAIQLNDTHPSLVIPEMMRILIDREELEWDKAWSLTKKIFAYTNHTLLPEAIERWPISLFERVLPRHLQIIYEINHRWLKQVELHSSNNLEMQQKLSIIEEGNHKQINMAHLAIIGSHKVNGVSALHSNLLKNHVFKQFSEIEPNKFTNKTNGITPRRWLKTCNPSLAELISSCIGHQWIVELSELEKLILYQNDHGFHHDWDKIKQNNKKAFSNFIFTQKNILVNPESMFDCQIKRIHEYKRQLLNVLRLIHDYCFIKDHPNADWIPRTIFFSGKAAPSYFIAKLIIKLITSVSRVINDDQSISNKLKIVFLENYCVTLAEKMIPAADLSEQISMAGTEASGTGNMKFALNGALTIGTFDGANIEILEEVGSENIFIFGMKAEEIMQLKETGYRPIDTYHQNADLKRVIDMIRDGFFNSENKNLFEPIIHTLLEGGDHYCLLADFASYIHCQNEVSKVYANQNVWIKKSIHNVAKMGKFSSDRTIKEYAQEIWGLRLN
ncbi:MAG: glycogen/starch/alpha-glucan phosphorylase [Chlamydiales bacterium]